MHYASRARHLSRAVAHAGVLAAFVAAGLLPCSGRARETAGKVAAGSPAHAGDFQKARAAERKQEGSRMTIKTIVDALLEERATVNSLAQLIGTNLKRKNAGSGYDLTPSDSRFRTAFIRIEAPAEGEGRDGGETPVYVELTVADAVDLGLDELSELFGEWRRVPPPPHGDPYRVVYYYDSPTSDYEAVITATLTEQPGHSGARVKKIIIRRESRLDG